MRKTSDLIFEMQKEAKKAWLVVIAVGFPEETRFVFSTGRNPVERLDELVQKGGHPIGLLRFDKENHALQGSYRPFREYAEADWVPGYLAGLLENADEIVAMSQKPT